MLCLTLIIPLGYPTWLIYAQGVITTNMLSLIRLQRPARGRLAPSFA